MRALAVCALGVGIVLSACTPTPPVAGTSTPNPPVLSSTSSPATSVPEPPEPTIVVLADGTEIGRFDGVGPVSAQGGYEGLADFVRRELTDDLVGLTGESEQQDATASDLGLEVLSGATVTISVDPDIQGIVETVLSDWNDNTAVVMTAIVVANDTGEVLAIAPATGSTDTFDPEMQLPAASLAGVYTTVAALEAGFDIDSMWDASSPQTFTSEEWEGEWVVANAGTSLEPTPLDRALMYAVNTVFAGVGVEVGAAAVIDAASRLGIDLGIGPDGGPPTVATGAGTMDLFEAAAMFTTLSRKGVRTLPSIIQSISDADGQVIYEHTLPVDVTVAPDVVETLRDPLSQVPVSGTGRRADIGVPQVGKTATDESFTAAWYVGSTDRYTTAVAVSRRDGAPLKDLDLNGRFYRRVFGGVLPALVWADIMKQVQR